MDRLLLKSSGLDVAAILRGLGWLAQHVRDGQVALLAVSTKAQVERGVVVEALGESTAKALAGDKTVELPGGGRLGLMTQRTPPPPTFNGPVLVVHPGKALLDVVDQLHASHALVIPWRDEDVQFWVDTWQPIVLGAQVDGMSYPFDRPRR